MTVDGIEIDYSGLPEAHRERVRLYIEHGAYPGFGWRAILSHDLEAVVRCDDATVAVLPQIYRWMHNHAPSQCHGSAARMAQWMEARRQCSP